MAVYMVDRHLPGITKGTTGRSARAAIETTREFTQQGKKIRYIRSMFVPGEERCMCLFEAENPQLVKEVNDAAKIPYTR
jgi:hypothetical protein